MHTLPALPNAAEDLLGLLYEGPLEMQPWERFLEALRVALHGCVAALTLHHPEDGGRDTYVLAQAPGDRTDWNEVERIYSERFIPMDPARLESIRPGQIVVVASTDVEPTFSAFLQRHGIAHALRTAVAEPGGTRCWLDVARDARAEPFGEEDVARVRALLPHLARALRLHVALKRAETERAVHEEMIDHLVLGGLLLNGRGEVIYATRAARKILAARSEVQLRGRRLVFRSAAGQQEFEDAVRAVAVTSESDVERFRGRVIGLGCEGARLGMLVRPVPMAPYGHGEDIPHAIVYFSDLAQLPEPLHGSNDNAQQLLAKLFGLTRQQARLALTMAEGRSLQQAAAKLGIGERTARNYSLVIYQKMGIKGQTDLVRFLYRSLALLR